MDIDDSRAMDSLQNIFIKLFFQCLHGLAHDVSDTLGLDAHVITSGIYPLDILLVHPGGTATIPDGESRGFLLRQSRYILLFEFCKTADALAADFAGEFLQ